MHDEGFFIKTGKVRFHSPGRPDIDAKAGDLVTIPIRLPHRFSNPFDEETIFVNTITPGSFVRYFECLDEMIGEGIELTPEINRAALLRFATIPLSDEQTRGLEEDRNGTSAKTQNGELSNGGTKDVAPTSAVASELDVVNHVVGEGVSEYGVPV